jgi:mannan endo-1,4-beta-mannosidase
MILRRRNTLTGVEYRNDPTIMAWELANEPRPGGGEEGNEAVIDTFLRWIGSISSFIREIDPRHLVTTGSEGSKGCLESIELFRRAHAIPTIDYAVFHLWPKNWGWFKVDRHQETLPESVSRAEAYFREHVAAADALDKPIVLEEFGLDRDGGLSIDHAVTSRDCLYGRILGLIEESIGSGGPAAGSNFWLWGGEGRPLAAGDAAPAADGIGPGDNPQEPQGLNTVLDCDSSTLALLAAHYSKLRRLGMKCLNE